MWNCLQSSLLYEFSGRVRFMERHIYLFFVSNQSKCGTGQYCQERTSRIRRKEALERRIVVNESYGINSVQGVRQRSKGRVFETEIKTG